MSRFALGLMIVLGISLASTRLPAQQTIGACALLSKEEVKKHLPWTDVLDSLPVEEEPVGTAGSACNYPSVFVQVLPFSPRMIDYLRENGDVETVTGVGDEAVFRNNADQYAELIVTAGKHTLTLQANVDSTVDAVKPGVLSLARAYVEKLR